MYKRTYISIYLIVFLVQAGCATSSPAIPTRSNEVREGFGAIAVTVGKATPKVKFHPPKRVKGVAAAAGRTSGRALGAMWGGCVQGPGGRPDAGAAIVWALIISGCVIATPFVAVGGALVGGGNSAAAEANRAARAAREPEVKALRAVVGPALSAVAAEKPLHARLLKQLAARTQSTVVTVPETGRPHYKKLLRNSMDTVLQADVVRIDVSTDNAFALTAKVQLIRLADREELYANIHTFTIASRSVSEWTTDGGEALQASLVRAYQALADEIVDALVGKNYGTAVARGPDESEQARTPQQIVTSAKNVRAPKTPSANSKATHPRGLAQQAGSAPRTDSPIEVSKAAPAATPSPSAAPSTVAKAAPRVAPSQQAHPSAQLREQTPGATIYKVAIFPFGGSTRCHGWGRPRNAELASNAHALIQQNDSLTLVSPAFSNPESLWKGGRKPNAQWAYSIGKDSGIDVILTYWRSESSFTYCSDNTPPFPAEVYLFDVAQQRMYRKKGPEENLRPMTEQALSDFLAGAKPRVVAMAPPAGIPPRPKRAAGGDKVKPAPMAPSAGTNPRTAPSAMIEKGAISSSYRIGIFPAAGNFGVENRSTQEEGSADILRSVIGAKNEFVLSYSDYHAEVRQPRIKPGDAYRLWTEDVIRRKPKVDKVCRVAQERDLDAVVMVWGDTPKGWGVGFFGDDSRNPVFIYLVDVEQHTVYRREGTFADITRMGELVLADFLKNRPELIRAKAAPAAK